MRKVCFFKKKGWVRRNQGECHGRLSIYCQIMSVAARLLPPKQPATGPQSQNNMAPARGRIMAKSIDPPHQNAK